MYLEILKPIFVNNIPGQVCIAKTGISNSFAINVHSGIFLGNNTIKILNLNSKAWLVFQQILVSTNNMHDYLQWTKIILPVNPSFTDGRMH